MEIKTKTENLFDYKKNRESSGPSLFKGKGEPYVFLNKIRKRIYKTMPGEQKIRQMLELNRIMRELVYSGLQHQYGKDKKKIKEEFRKRLCQSLNY